MSTGTHKLYEFGEFRLSEAERCLWRLGTPVNLPPRTIDTLIALVRRHGHIVSREELLESVWPDTFVEEHNINVCISTLRKTLDGKDSPTSLIETVTRRGYRFSADVRQCFEDDPEVIVVEKQTRSTTRIDHEEIIDRQDSSQPMVSELAGRRPLKIATLVLVLVGITAGMAVVYSRLAGLGPVKIDSVAVLPFSSESADVEYFGDGLAESLIIQLAKHRDIRVTSRTSAFAYKGKQVEADRIANELNVRSVLTGRIVGVGERLKIHAELIDTATKSQLWGKQFDLRRSDLQAVQNEIATSVLGRMGVTVQLSSYETSPEAYDAYLKGMDALKKKLYKDAAHELERSTALDPNLAVAYAGLASAYAGHTTYEMPPHETRARVKETALKALSLDGSLAYAHLALAQCNSLIEFKFDEADREYRKAVEIIPNDADLHLTYASFLTAMGRFDEAGSEIEAARQLDPFNQRNNQTLYWMYLARRDFASAQAVTEMIQAADPTSYLPLVYETQILWATGEYDKAIDTARRVVELQDDPTASNLAVSYALAGRRDEALRIIPVIEKAYQERRITCDSCISRIYAALGNSEKTMELLERAYLNGEAPLRGLRYNSLYDPIRNEPRFVEFIKKMNFPN